MPKSLPNSDGSFLRFRVAKSRRQPLVIPEESVAPNKKPRLDIEGNVKESAAVADASKMGINPCLFQFANQTKFLMALVLKPQQNQSQQIRELIQLASAADI